MAALILPSLTRYFRQKVDSDADVIARPPEWGQSSIYYETSEEGFPIRQIQLFANGNVLVYDDDQYLDDFGWRRGEPVSRYTPSTVEISRDQFQRVWQRHGDALNRRPATQT